MAVILRERDAERFRRYLDNVRASCLSTATLHEAYCMLRRDDLASAAPELQKLLALLQPELVPFDVAQLAEARSCYLRYGRGSQHPAGLNMGDCFAYALAKTRDLPLLFKGDDFIHTDVRPALTLD
jgi:ribonuclease VapC